MEPKVAWSPTQVADRKAAEERVAKLRGYLHTVPRGHSLSYRCGHTSQMVSTYVAVLVDCGACHAERDRATGTCEALAMEYKLNQPVRLWDDQEAFSSVLKAAGLRQFHTQAEGRYWEGLVKPNWYETVIDLLRVGVVEYALAGGLWGKI